MFIYAKIETTLWNSQEGIFDIICDVDKQRVSEPNDKWNERKKKI